MQEDTRNVSSFPPLPPWVKLYDPSNSNPPPPPQHPEPGELFHSFGKILNACSFFLSFFNNSYLR